MPRFSGTLIEPITPNSRIAANPVEPELGSIGPRFKGIPVEDIPAPKPVQDVGNDVTGDTLTDFVKSDPIVPAVLQSAKESVGHVQPVGELPLGLPVPENKIAQGVLDVAYGIPEAAASLASGIGGFIGGQVGGATAIPERGLPGAFDRAEAINQVSTYQPKTATASLLLKPIELLFGTLSGTVDKVARQTAPEGASKQELDDRSKASQYVVNSLLLGAPLVAKGIGKIKIDPGKVTPEAIASSKAKVMADPAVPPSVKAQVAKVENPLEAVVGKIDEAKARAAVTKGGGVKAKFPGNQDVVDGILMHAELASGGKKYAFNKLSKIVAEHDGPIEAADLGSIKGINPTGTTGQLLIDLLEGRKGEPKVETPPHVTGRDAFAPETPAPVSTTAKATDPYDTGELLPPMENSPLDVKKEAPPPGFYKIGDGLHPMETPVEAKKVDVPVEAKAPEGAPTLVEGQAIIDSIDPSVKYQGPDSLGLQQFITKDGINFSSLSLDSAEIKHRMATTVEKFKPTETPKLSFEDTPEFDSIKIAREEGYEFPSKRTYKDPEAAQAKALELGNGHEVVKTGKVYRVGRYPDEIKSDLPPMEGETNIAREVYDLTKAEEAKTAETVPEGITDEFGPELLADDWKVLEELWGAKAKDEMLKMDSLREALAQGVKDPVDMSAAAQRFLEWRDSYVTKCHEAKPASKTIRRKKKISKEALPILDDQFAVFKTIEEAQAYKEATGKTGQIIQDPMTKQYIIEPTIDLLGEKELPEAFGDEYFGDVVEVDRLSDESVLRDGRSAEQVGDLWDIMNNERGSVDVSDLRAIVDQIEYIQHTAKKMSTTIEKYIDSIGLDENARKAVFATIARLPQIRQEIKDKDPITGELLMPTGKIVAQSIKRDKLGRVVHKNVPITEEMANAVMGASRKTQWGKDIAHVDPKTGKIRIEHVSSPVARFMRATETKINSFTGPLRKIYHMWRDALKVAKDEIQTTETMFRELKKQIDPDRLENFAISCYWDMKSAQEALRKVGIEGYEALTPKEVAIQNQLMGYWRKSLIRTNYVRTNTGQRAIPRLLDLHGEENYLPLLRDLEALRTLGINDGLVNSKSSRLGELSKTFNGMWNPSSKKRHVSDIPINLDPFENSIKASKWVIREVHISPIAALAKELANVKLPVPGKTGRMSLREWNPYLSQMLSRWSDSIVGKDPVATAMANSNPWAHWMYQTLSKNLVIATIGGSLRTIFVQPSSYIIQVPTKLDMRAAAYGITRLMAEKALSRKGSLARKESSVLAIREPELAYADFKEYLQNGVVSGWKGYVSDKSMLPMKVVDSLVAEASWNAAYDYGGRKLGLGGKDLVHFADDVVETTQGLGIKGAVSDIQNSMGTKWLTLLQTFGIADFNFIIKDVLGIKNADVNNKQALWRAAKYTLSTILAGQLYKSMGLENVVPDPIGEYLKVMKDTNSTPHAIVSAASELLEKIPIVGGSAKYSSNLGGVMGEWGSIVPKAAAAFAKNLDWDNISRRERDKNMMLIAKAVGYSFGIPFTNQIMKSIRTAYNGGNPYEIIMGVYKDASKKKSYSTGL